jgi:hypothetical protein
MEDLPGRHRTTLLFHVGRFSAIFVAVLGAGAAILADEIDSIARGLGLAAVAFTLSLVIELAIPLWKDNRRAPLLLASIVIFYIALSLFAWFGFLKDRNPQLEPYASAQTLLSFVGKDIARTCKVFVNNEYYVGEKAAIECSPPDLLTFNLALFDDVDAMNEDFSNAIEPVEGVKTADVEDCKSGEPREGEWQSTTGTRQSTVGRFLCYVDNERDAWIQWTYNEHKIYAYAIRDDDNTRALHDWWNRFWSVKA